MMDTAVSARFAALLRDRQEGLTAAWLAAVTKTLRGRQSEAELSAQLREMYGALRQVADAGNLDLDNADAAELRAVLNELSRNRARNGFSVKETAASVAALKQALLGTLSEASTDDLRAFIEYSVFVDQMALYTFECYTKAREELISDQAEQLLELSTPVVKLWDGVLAVPLVGTLDSARAQVVMERLLQALVDTSSPYAIIDITGVSAVDTQVAQHILKTVVAARLMGADCIISGIRPQIAQTIVALGIEFNDIVTKSSLADALLHALRAQRCRGRTPSSSSGGLMDRVPVLTLGDVSGVHPDRPRRPDRDATAGRPGREDFINRRARRDHRHHRAQHRGLIRRSHAVDDRVHLAGTGCRNCGCRHATSRGDHAGRARVVTQRRTYGVERRAWPRSVA